MEFPALVAGVQADDPQACEVLFQMVRRSYSQRTWRWLGEETEDALQEIILKAVMAIRRGQMKDPERLAGWIRAIVVNHTHEYWRKHRKNAPPLADMVQLEEYGLKPDPTPNPEQLAIQNERAAILRHHLATTLNARERGFVWDHETNDVPIRQLAEESGLKINTIKVMIWRSRMRLRPQLRKAA